MVAVPDPWVGAAARVWIYGLGEPYLSHPVASVTAQQSGATGERSAPALAAVAANTERELGFLSSFQVLAACDARRKLSYSATPGRGIAPACAPS